MYPTPVRNPSTVYAKINNGNFMSSNEEVCAERRAIPFFIKEYFSFANTNKFRKRISVVRVILIRMGINKIGDRYITNSMPCTNCKAYMKLLERQYNIKFNIIHSNNDGLFEKKTTNTIGYHERKKAIGERNNRLKKSIV